MTVSTELSVEKCVSTARLVRTTLRAKLPKGGQVLKSKPKKSMHSCWPRDAAKFKLDWNS